MREAKVFYNGRFAGILTQLKNGYRFRYDPEYLAGSHSRSVSLTLPLRATVYESETLFPFFVNMLSEGANKAMQVRLLKIDERDYFGLLLATAGHDSIGPITLEEIK